MKLYAQAMSEENPYQSPLSQEEITPSRKESVPIGKVSFVVVWVLTLILGFLVLGCLIWLGVIFFEPIDKASIILHTLSPEERRMLAAIKPGGFLFVFSVSLYSCIRYLLRWIRQPINRSDH